MGLRASERGLERVEYAMRRRGWTKTQTALWWETALTSQATLRRFWRRKSIQDETFIRICEAVGLRDWRSIAAEDDLAELATQGAPRIDWGTAPDVPAFYGRTAELDTLAYWLVGDSPAERLPQQCRLVVVLGMGGIGKTAVAVKLVQQLIEAAENSPLYPFDCIIWRSLHHVGTLTDLLNDLIRCLSADLFAEVPDTGNELLSTLLQLLGPAAHAANFGRLGGGFRGRSRRMLPTRL